MAWSVMMWRGVVFGGVARRSVVMCGGVLWGGLGWRGVLCDSGKMQPWLKIGCFFIFFYIFAYLFIFSLAT